MIFKAKRVDNGEWVEGYHGFKEESQKHFIMVETLCNQGGSYFTENEVIAETVCRSVGLTNIKGEPVYEGDALISGSARKYIGWCNKCKRFQIHSTDGVCVECFCQGCRTGRPTWMDCGFCELYESWKTLIRLDGEIEVIGNIHDKDGGAK